MSLSGCKKEEVKKEKEKNAWEQSIVADEDKDSSVDEMMREWDKEQSKAYDKVEDIYEKGGVDVSDDYVTENEKETEDAGETDADKTEVNPDVAATPEITPVPIQFDSSTVFIGDSVMQGVNNYEVFPDAEFLTKVGLNIYSLIYDSNFMTKDGEVNVENALQTMEVKNVFYMIGSNEIEWMDTENILHYNKEFIEILRKYNKDIKIYAISVPPIRHQYEVLVPDVTQEKIDAYNVKLKALCEEEGISYIDIATPMKGKDGYLKKSYSESDGMHWKELGCKAFRKCIKEYLHIK